MKLNLVVCHWEIDSKHDCKLVKSYPVDIDGYSMEPRKEGEKGDGEAPWQNWLYDREDFERQPIMGRSVTSWSMGSGINLMGYNPPKWVSWISNTFYDQIKKDDLWVEMLKEGNVMYFGTLNEVSKYVKEAKCT